MESDIVTFTKAMFHADDETFGITTGGGTDSISNVVLAYKLWAREVKGIHKPNFVAC